MAENNEKKRFGRRAGGGVIAATLVSLGFYVCLFKGIDLEWFKVYTTVMVGIYGFVMGGLTLTDILLHKK